MIVVLTSVYSIITPTDEVFFIGFDNFEKELDNNYAATCVAIHNFYFEYAGISYVNKIYLE